MTNTEALGVSWEGGSIPRAQPKKLLFDSLLILNLIITTETSVDAVFLAMIFLIQKSLVHLVETKCKSRAQRKGVGFLCTRGLVGVIVLLQKTQEFAFASCRAPRKLRS